MARLLKSTGEVIQNVEGYIEFVYVGNTILVVNEEGLLNNLPHNQQASNISQRPLVGDVIVCSVAEIN